MTGPGILRGDTRTSAAAGPMPGPPPGGPDTLVFSHANGFPAGTYRQLFEHWRAAGWQVQALPMFGHDQAYPVRSNWSPTRDELLAFIDRTVPAGRPVCLVGHSLGGILSLLAACRQPARAAAVVMIDSPVVAGWRAHGVQVAKATGLIRRVSPGRISRARRWQWPSADEALRLYATKPVFARWAPGVLDDYLRCGLEPDPSGGGVRLAFHREVETKFYNTLPHHMDRLLRRHPPHCPVGFVGGTRSQEMRQAGMEGTRRVCKGHLTMIDGSHLFPMEKPLETAKAVVDMLAGFLLGSGVGLRAGPDGPLGRVG